MSSSVKSQLVTVDNMSDPQLELARRYAEIAGISAPLMGAVVGDPAWNLGGLFLDKGVLKMLRVSDPVLARQPEVYRAMGEIYRKLSVLTEKYHLHGVGAAEGYFWSIRNYVQKTLAETSGDELVLSGYSLQALASELVQIVVDLGRDTIVHGHICPSNVSVEQGVPVLLDYCYSAFSPELRGSRARMAPETRSKGAISPRADVFGLGLVLNHLLGRSASEQQQEMIAQMVQQDPYQRPEIKSVLPVFPGDVQQATTKRKRQRQATFYAGSGRSADEAVAWAKNTVSLSPDIIARIQDAVASDATPEQMAHLGKVLKERVSEERHQPSAFAEAPSAPGVAAGAVQTPSAVPTAPIAAPQTPPPSASSELPPSLGPSSQGDFTSRGIASLKELQKSHVIMLILLGGLLLGIGYRKGVFDSYFAPDIPMVRYWESGIPSKMGSVARAALDYNSYEAQDIIVSDILSGNNPPRVHAEFLRRVFDPNWEADLSEEDRELALRIGLSPLDREFLTGQGTPEFLEHHPALTYGQMLLLPLGTPDKSLAGVPLSKVSNLPAPMGQAFTLISAAGVSNAGDPAARALARILRQDSEPSTVEALFSGASKLEDIHARYLLLYNLAEGSAPLRESFVALAKRGRAGVGPLLEWFSKSRIAKWSSLSLEARMAVVAGRLKGVKLETAHYADLLTHPLEALRDLALKVLVAKSPPAAAATFAYLSSPRSALSRTQKGFLSTALVLEGEPQYVLLSQWFDTGPAEAEVVALLMTRANLSGLDPFSVEAARYLSSKQWKGSVPSLKAMLSHHEAMVRVLAISQLDAAAPAQREVLQAQLLAEENDRLKEQLRLKLEETEALVAK